MLCPLRVLAHEADFENEENKGTIKYDNIDAHCLEKRCAWWNRDFEMCSIAVLATVGTPKIHIVEKDDLVSEQEAEQSANIARYFSEHLIR
jgi:hypothetical protein